MQKTAQKRSILNKLREMTNVSGIAAEKFFNPQFEEVMKNIRAKDDQIRSLVAGEKIGSGDAPQSKSLKELLKQSKSNLNRREYMASVADLGRFHEQVKRAVDEINSIDDKVNEVHNQFLFKDLGDEHKEQLSSLRNRFEKKQASLVRQAGIMDFFYNVGTKRGRALAAWEKRYPQETNKFKNGITALLQKSQNLLEITIASLKEMASARSVRNIDNYVTSAAKIKKAFSIYEDGKSGFKEFYNTTLKPYLSKMEAFDSKPSPDVAVPTAPAPGASELAKQEIPVGTTTSPLAYIKPDTVTPTVPPQQEFVGSTTIPTPPPENMQQGLIDVDVDRAPDTLRMPPPSGMKAAHKKFFATLETLSNESPIILASFIRKYAQTIQSADPETSINLFKIAKSIKG